MPLGRGIVKGWMQPLSLVYELSGRIHTRVVRLRRRRVMLVNQIQQYSAAEMERMMKVQDVLLKAMAKKITWWAAAEILGVTDRTMRRWRDRMEEGGYAGLADRRKGKASAQRIPVVTVEKVLALYKDTYFDLNIRHFHEKLRDQHDIRLSY